MLNYLTFEVGVEMTQIYVIVYVHHSSLVFFTFVKKAEVADIQKVSFNHSLGRLPKCCLIISFSLDFVLTNTKN